jgi:hypothetical protein
MDCPSRGLHDLERNLNAASAETEVSTRGAHSYKNIQKAKREKKCSAAGALSGQLI